MFRSIRWSLFGWHALLLFSVLGLFGGALYSFQVEAAYSQIDAELAGLARTVGGSVQKKGKVEKSDKATKTVAPLSRGTADQREAAAKRKIALTKHALHLFKKPDGRNFYFAVWLDEGELLDSAPAGACPFPPRSNWPKGPPLRDVVFRDRGNFREALVRGPHDTRVLVGKCIVEEKTRLEALLVWLVATGAGVLVFGAAGGLLLCHRVLKPIHEISTTAEQISATNLSHRIDVRETKTELGRLAHVLDQTFARLQAAFDQQTRFTADASHELRTPLAVIQSQAEHALRRERSAEEYREALTAVRRAADRMRAVVEDLLTLARADAGQLVVDPEPVDLRRIVSNVAAILGPLAVEKTVRINLLVREAVVLGDDRRLTQVVTNLLTNAIVYNRDGGQVDVGTESTNACVRLSIRDTGPGIREEDQAHVFERFFRADKSRDRAFGGNGLGLAICKEIVRAHGGTITVSSLPGEGSTFTVELPAALTPERESENDAAFA